MRSLLIALFLLPTAALAAEPDPRLVIEAGAEVILGGLICERHYGDRESVERAKHTYHIEMAQIVGGDGARILADETRQQAEKQLEGIGAQQPPLGVTTKNMADACKTTLDRRIEAFRLAGARYRVENAKKPPTP